MILMGILSGPYVLAMIDDKILAISTELRERTLIVILLRARISPNFKILRKTGHPAIIVPRMIFLIDEGHERKKGVLPLVLGGASLDDVYVNVLFYAFVGLHQGGSISITNFFAIPIAIILGIVIGVLFDLIFQKSAYA